MGYELDKGRHSVYALQYHFVQCIKYRRKALVDPGVIDKLKEQVHNISETFDVEVLNIETDEDHFHMIFKGHPTLELTRYINAVKTLTSREIQRNYPEIKEMLWEGKFWSRSYFLATTGQVPLDSLKRYVEDQGKEKK